MLKLCITADEGMQVREVVVEGEGPAARATGVRLADGRVFRGRAIVSNATRWDTFDGLLPPERLPEPERLFRCDTGCAKQCLWQR